MWPTGHHHQLLLFCLPNAVHVGMRIAGKVEEELVWWLGAALRMGEF